MKRLVKVYAYIAATLLTLWGIAGAFWLMSQPDTFELILGILALGGLGAIWQSWFSISHWWRTRKHA